MILVSGFSASSHMKNGIFLEVNVLERKVFKGYAFELPS